MKPNDKEKHQKKISKHLLEEIIDMDHPLVKLSQNFDWETLEKDFNNGVSESVQEAVISPRMMAGLHYLKYTQGETDESLLAQYIENPYWQYFCGAKQFNHTLPFDAKSLEKWRQELSVGREQSLLRSNLEGFEQEKFQDQKERRLKKKALPLPKEDKGPSRSSILLDKIKKTFEDQVKDLGNSLNLMILGSLASIGIFTQIRWAYLHHFRDLPMRIFLALLGSFAVFLVYAKTFHWFLRLLSKNPNKREKWFKQIAIYHLPFYLLGLYPFCSVFVENYWWFLLGLGWATVFAYQQMVRLNCFQPQRENIRKIWIELRETFPLISVIFREKRVAIFLFLLFSLTAIYVRHSELISEKLDTVQLLTMTENIKTEGFPLNPYLTNIIDYAKRVGVIDWKDGMSADLTPDPHTKANHLKFHSYFFLYLVAPLTWIFPTDWIWSVLDILSFTIFLFFFYFFLRKNKISIWGSFVFLVLLSSHPAWSEAFYGQIYVDRMFLMFGILFIYNFVYRSQHKIITFLLGLICASLLERGAVIAGIFAVAYTFFYWEETKENRRFNLILGISFVLFSIGIIKFYLNNFYYQGGFLPSSFADLQNRLSLPAFREKLWIFIGVNFLTLGWLALFGFRAFLLALIMMLPNMLGNIGGAEKTGWSTHYHCHYLPFLAWAAASGYIVLWNKLSSNYKKRFLVFFMALLCCFSLCFDYSGNRPKKLSMDYFQFNPFYQNYIKFNSYYFHPKELLGNYYKLQEAIPPKSTVSMPDMLFGALWQKRTLYMFPLGLERSDYAIPVVISYIGKDNEERLTKVLLQRMKKIGYDMDHPIICGHIKIYRRVQKKSGAK